MHLFYVPLILEIYYYFDLLFIILIINIIFLFTNIN